MPKIAVDYSKTQMYKLKHKDDAYDENIYIGHTTNWIQRKGNHKKCCNNENSKEYNAKNYQTIRENGGWEEWEMIWIEDYPCNNNNEARAREEYLRCNNNAKLNTIRAIRTQEENIQIRKEYREDNIDKLKEHSKEYYNNNKEILNKRKKEKITCECGCFLRKDSLKDHIITQKHIIALQNKNVPY